MVDWGCLGKERFTDPLFEQTIDVCLRHPFNLLFRHQTPIELLGEVAATFPMVPPSGFIFHLSRCGSTLVSQMLAALPQNIVTAVLIDADGSIWIGTGWGGMARFQPGQRTWTYFGWGAGLPSNDINAFAADFSTTPRTLYIAHNTGLSAYQGP